MLSLKGFCGFITLFPDKRFTLLWPLSKRDYVLYVSYFFYKRKTILLLRPKFLKVPATELKITCNVYFFQEK